MKRSALALLVAVLLPSPAAAQAPDSIPYRKPARRIAGMVEAPPTPSLLLSPDRKTFAVAEPPAFLTIADLAQPELRLAGLRINPRTSGPSRRTPLTRLSFLSRDGSRTTPLSGLPAKPRLGDPQWSPDGARLAFTITEDRGISLWVADPARGTTRRLTAARLNGTVGAPCTWLPDSRGLLCKMVPATRGREPVPAQAPRGPVVQESAGVKSGAPTFQDLLKGPHDEALFEHYLTAQLTRVGLDGSAASIGAPGLHLGATPSPDGRWLLIETLHRPWSYVFPIDRFPRRFQIWRPDGKLARQIADIPLADRVPVTFAAVREGPRELEWRADAPASLCWVEAKDGGDPERKAAVRDHLLCLADPSARTPRILARLPLRFDRVDWGNAKLALVSEWWWDNRKTRTYVIDPSSPAKRRVLWDRSFEDRYSDPGAPAMKPTPRGTRVLHMTADNRALFLVGDGASPAGDLPFLDRLHLETGKAERLWRCKAPHYEKVGDILDDAATEVVTRRESKSQQPNYVLLSLQSGRRRQITAFPHPAPELAGVEKRLLKYRRKDGVELTGMLYLPPGWTPKKGRLPLLMWAYPQEFKSAQAAGQVQDSPHRFVRLEWWSPLFALLLGYAVLDDPSLPIIGEGAAEPNDTYVEQLVMGAQAAVDEVVRLGVASRDRVAIGGHSYGAFMAANLLAHSDIFRTGIARSGAYNRTLTPFGFQAEERMYWQAPETYHRMSPFSAAHRIDEPILLIHGEADNNPGTYTMQSQRLFEAIKALGGTARLVLLPHESHGYRASESVLHVMWEMARWLETHTRPRKRPPRRVLPPPAVRGAQVQDPVNPLNSKGSGVV